MTWADGPLLALDYETTGTDPASCRPVSAALVWLDREGITAADTFIVDSGVPCPPDAEAVHGITAERIAAEGIDPDVVALTVCEQLAEAAAKNVPLVIYNARFDLRLALAEAERYGLVLPDVRVIDPLVIDRHFDKYRSGGRKLGTVCAHYGVDLTDAHDATADAVAAGQLALAMADDYQTVRKMPLKALYDAQVSWFRAWRHSFNNFLARKNDNPQFVTGEWPR